MEVRPLIIGVGNPECGDDGAGPAVIRALDRYRRRSFDTALCGDDLTGLMELWRERDEVVVVDMVQLPQTLPGTVQRFDVSHAGLPYELSCSSHTLSLSQCIELARALGRLPGSVSVIGIAGVDVRLGESIGMDVLRAVQTVAAELAAEFGESDA